MNPYSNFCFFICRPLSVRESVFNSSEYAVCPNGKVKLQILPKIKDLMKLMIVMLEISSDYR